MRLAACYRCLQETKLTFFGSDGISDVDVDASSQPYWCTWRKRLDPQQLLLLAVYRGGACSIAHSEAGDASEQYEMSCL